MKKAYLTRSDGRYLLETDLELIDLGKRKPSKKRLREATNPAIGEEVIIVDKSVQP